MDPRSAKYTATAISASRGASTTRAAAETRTSAALLVQPGQPETDLCRLSREAAAFLLLAGPFCDDFPDPGLEGFTRKCLHSISNLLCRPSQGFKSPHCPDEIIRMLL